MNSHRVAAAMMATFVTACGSSASAPRVSSATTFVTSATTSATTSPSSVTTSVTHATSRSESSTEISVNGGTISASVVDGVVEVLEVTTADGWTMEREDSENGAVTLRFNRGTEQSEVRLQLTADGGLQQSTSVRSTSGDQSSGG